MGSGGSRKSLIVLFALALLLGCARSETPCEAGSPGCVCTSLSDGSQTCVEGKCPTSRKCQDLCCNEGQSCENGSCVADPDACIYIPKAGEFEEPIRAWWWPFEDDEGEQLRDIELPEFSQVMMTPAVVRLRPEDPPAVIFNSYISAGPPNVEGVLRIVRGDTGEPILTVTDPDLRVNGVSSIAVGDITGDGRIEIVTGAYDPAGTNEGGLIAFRDDGSLLWKRPGIWVGWGGPSIAQLDGEGPAEVIIGSTVLNGATGEIRCQGNSGIGDNGVGPLSVVADIDGDGQLEIVTGNAAYRLEKDSSGNEVCRNIWPTLRHKNGELMRDGFVAVADLIDDPKLPTSLDRPEVVVVSRGTIRIHDWTGGVLWGPFDLPGGGLGGPPTIADFDGDGEPEIGVAGLMNYTVFKLGAPKGILWTRETQDFSSSTTGSSVFDFDGNGRDEVVYQDECFLHVFDGREGVSVFTAPNTTCTAYELPVVADVTGDGAAEIVVPANNHCSIDCPYGSHAGAGMHGIQVFKSPSDAWVGSRPVWNQHGYHVTNVGDNGEIPMGQERFWGEGTRNSFRQNYQGDGTFAAPDLQIASLRLDGSDCPNSLEVVAEVENIGSRGIRPGLPVAFYEEGAKDRDLLGVVTLPIALQPGDKGEVRLEWKGPPRVNAAVVSVVADDFGEGNEPRQRHRECNEDNNTMTIEQVVCREAG